MEQRKNDSGTARLLRRFAAILDMTGTPEWVRLMARTAAADPAFPARTAGTERVESADAGVRAVSELFQGDRQRRETLARNYLALSRAVAGVKESGTRLRSVAARPPEDPSAEAGLQGRGEALALQRRTADAAEASLLQQKLMNRNLKRLQEESEGLCYA